MKRIYLSALSLFAICTINAQVSSPKFEVTSKTAPNVAGNLKAPKPASAEKVTYLSQDFETWPLAAGWLLSSGPASTITVPASQAWHQTTNGNPGGGCGILYVNSVDTHDENLITPEITLPASGNFRLNFDFNTSRFWHVTPNDNVDITLTASTDGGTTWGPVLWQEDDDALLLASYSNDWETYVYKRAYVNVSAFAGMDVMFKFNYFGVDGAQCTLDNIVVEDIPDNNLSVLKSYTGDIIGDFDYSSVPVSQVKPMVIGTIIRNDGVLAQNGKVINAKIKLGGTEVYNGNQTMDFPAGTQDTVWFTTGYTPTTLGVYTCEFTLPADDITTDNTAAVITETTNYLYAHDYNGTGVRGFDQDDETAMGTLYLMTTNATATAINVKFGAGTTVGQEVVVALYGLQTSIQGTLDFVTEVYYTVQASDLTATSTVIEFLAPVTLTAGTTYMAYVKKQAGTTRLYVNSTNNGDDDFSTACFGPFGASSAINWFNGWGWSPHVKLNFDPTLSISTLVDLQGVNVYPNPSEGMITISNDLNAENTITVTDMTGKVVLTKASSSATTVDLSKVGTGVYMVEVSNENGKKVERVVIR